MHTLRTRKCSKKRSRKRKSRRPEPALICCKGLGVMPEDALMIGDSVFDLQCGNAAGCDSVFVTWSYATSREQALHVGDPTYIIERPEQLLRFV